MQLVAAEGAEGKIPAAKKARASRCAQRIQAEVGDGRKKDRKAFPERPSRSWLL